MISIISPKNYTVEIATNWGEYQDLCVAKDTLVTLRKGSKEAWKRRHYQVHIKFLEGIAEKIKKAFDAVFAAATVSIEVNWVEYEMLLNANATFAALLGATTDKKEQSLYSTNLKDLRSLAEKINEGYKEKSKRIKEEEQEGKE